MDLMSYNYVYVRAVFTHENQEPSRVKFLATGNGGASEFAEQFKDDGVFYGLRKSRNHLSHAFFSLLWASEVCLRLNLRPEIVNAC